MLTSLMGQGQRIHRPMQEVWVQSLGREGAPEKEMATTHSSILAWEIPWTEEQPGGLQSMRSQWVGHDSVTKQQQ